MEAAATKHKAFSEHGPVNPSMIRADCQVKGTVRTLHVKKKRGISGGKASAALMTGAYPCLLPGAPERGIYASPLDNCGSIGPSKPDREHVMTMDSQMCECGHPKSDHEGGRGHCSGSSCLFKRMGREWKNSALGCSHFKAAKAETQEIGMQPHVRPLPRR